MKSIQIMGTLFLYQEYNFIGKNKMISMEDKEALLHYTIAFIGGYMGVYPVIYVAKAFASAQTANQISLLVALANGDIKQFILRTLGLIVYCLPIIYTTLTINKKKDLKKIAIIVDIIDVFILWLLPDSVPALLALLPNFFAMSLHWCSFNGAYGFVAAPIFSTNNTRQWLSSVVEVYINKNKGFRQKMNFYGYTLLSFNVGVLLCALLSKALHRASILLTLMPLLVAICLNYQLRKELTKK